MMACWVVATISRSALAHNLALCRSQVPAGVPLCPAVKADGYGHDLRIVLDAARQAGVERIAVAHPAEAIAARQAGWRCPILCFAPVLGVVGESERRALADEAVAQSFCLTVMSLPEAKALSDAAVRGQRTAEIEIKIDSGMGRMGLAPEAGFALAQRVPRLPGLKIAGVYTHLATADEADLGFAREQLTRFLDLRDRLRAAGIPVGQYHAANSAALFRMPETILDRVRPGLAVYGYWTGPARERPPLRPCLRVTAPLLAVRRLPAGHDVGYGRTWTARRDSLIGVVPVGYADGYRRLLGNTGVMTLPPTRGQSARQVPVVGRISMDQATVDLTNAGDVQPGDPIIIIDDDPASPHSVEALAEALQTIPYEITCLLGPRVRRIAVD